MKCPICNEDLEHLLSYDHPTVMIGSRMMWCPEHPHIVSKAQWHMPNIKQIITTKNAPLDNKNDN